MSSSAAERQPDEALRVVPLAGRDGAPRRLPVPLTALIGRTAELASLERLLRDPAVRLVTLTGAGGSGKTRLAIEAATRQSDDYPDGVVFIPLAAIHDPSLLLPTIAHALGIRDSGGRILAASLSLALRDRDVLLVLDNLEQIVAAAPAIGDLLSACPGVVVLATSREPLRLRGEHLLPVAPLALPASDRLLDGEILPASTAVALFVERARQAQPAFQVTAANAADVVAICRRLDGLPLALELAAPLLRVLSPQELLARLERRLPLLTGGERDLPERQRTLRSAIAWSYGLLDPPEQAFFRRLAVFSGGFTLDAAERVTAIEAWGSEASRSDEASRGRSDLDSLSMVTALSAKSLLTRVESSAEQELGESRYIMLETIREFAWEVLAEHGEEECAREAHADSVLWRVEAAEAALTGPKQAIWLDQLEDEQDNVRSALRWSLDGAAAAGFERAAERALRIGAALWRYWWARGDITEGRQWLTRALAVAPRGGSRWRARALRAAGDLAETQGHYHEAQSLHEEALAMFRALDDQPGVAQTLNDLAIVWQYQGNYARATKLFEESLHVSRALGDRRGVARGLSNLAGVAFAQGDFAGAAARYDEGLAEFRALGDRGSICTTLSNMGEVALRRGDHAAAVDLNAEALACHHELGDRQGTATAQANLGEAYWRQGQQERAIALLDEALRGFRELGDARLTAIVLYHRGRIEQQCGNTGQALPYLRDALQLEDQVGDRDTTAAILEQLAGIATSWQAAILAAQCLGAATARREETDTPRSALEDADAALWRDAAYAQIVAERGPQAFAAAWDAGRAMPLAQLIADSLSLAPPQLTTLGESVSDAGARYEGHDMGLTQRELEILRLIDRGYSGRQIAQELFISQRTGATHVTNICGKLGVRSRTAALAAARQLGII